MGKYWFWHFAVGAGRLCISAYLPGKDKEISMVPVGFAWTSPTDINKYNKSLARKISMGRADKIRNQNETDSCDQGMMLYYSSRAEAGTPHEVLRSILNNLSLFAPSWAKKAIKSRTFAPLRTKAIKHYSDVLVQNNPE